MIYSRNNYTDAKLCSYNMANGVVVACLVLTAAIGVRISVLAVKFHHVYDYTIVRHPWQVSENHKPQVHPSHVREIEQSVRYPTKQKMELYSHIN